jgi:hypothetical protein
VGEARGRGTHIKLQAQTRINTCTSSFTSAMHPHLSIVGLPPLVGHMYRRAVNKLVFERGKRAVFEKCVENLTKLVI